MGITEINILNDSKMNENMIIKIFFVYPIYMYVYTY